MGLEKVQAQNHEDKGYDLCLHVFSNLSSVSPVVFIYLLRECYFSGTSKATAKFRALQQHVYEALHNNPQPGPATFVVQCLYVLPVLEEHCEGFSHLITSALYRLLKIGTTLEDSSEARQLAANLFLLSVWGNAGHEARILVKLVKIFDVGLLNIEKAICCLGAENRRTLEETKEIVEQYIYSLVDSQSYVTVVSLLEQFSIRQSGESFLFKMIDSKQFKAAEQWATFMGRETLCILVQEYISKNKLKAAFEIVRKNNLLEEFSELYEKYKARYMVHTSKKQPSSIKKLAEKGCWDVAETRIKGDTELLQYLVYLAMEAGYTEKVDELCAKYSLEAFVKAKKFQIKFSPSLYLQLHDLALKDVIWVDEFNGLEIATNHIEESKLIGLDCEWKPNYMRGCGPNKVSIMQIALGTVVYIFDLIKLSADIPVILDDCMQRILHSPTILKLGYNFQCDIKLLAQTYGEFECFKRYDMLLDIQNLFKEPRGGLSGLAEKILGVGLNKTRRNSNWEERPLSQNQLEYAALDAAVLIHIFNHVRDCSPSANASEGNIKIEWNSKITSRMDNPIS